MVKKVKICCSACGKEVEKLAAEIKRQEKRGRKDFYCGLSCAGSVNHSHLAQYLSQNKDILKNYNRIDEFTIFRYHLRNAKTHTKKCNRDILITLQDLQEIWNKQNGLCAVTNIPMLNKTLSKSTISKSPYQASLDRIDCSKGYTKNNVRFVCYMFNIARNDFNDVEVIEFCKQVAKNQE
jgi:hypothetical protein